MHSRKGGKHVEKHSGKKPWESLGISEAVCQGGWEIDRRLSVWDCMRTLLTLRLLPFHERYLHCLVGKLHEPSPPPGTTGPRPTRSPSFFRHLIYSMYEVECQGGLQSDKTNTGAPAGPGYERTSTMWENHSEVWELLRHGSWEKGRSRLYWCSAKFILQTGKSNWRIFSRAVVWSGLGFTKVLLRILGEVHSESKEVQEWGCWGI